MVFFNLILILFSWKVMRHPQFYLLSINSVLFRWTTNKGVVKCFFIEGHILACMRVYVESLHVISIDNTIGLTCSVVSTVVLETLTIEIFSKGCIWEISRLISHVFVKLFDLFVSVRLFLRPMVYFLFFRFNILIDLYRRGFDIFLFNRTFF